MENVRSQDEPEEIDIAVVGAGVAGTYFCWRLKDAKLARDPVLFEMSDRIGGRLYSVDVPHMPNIKGELGGMRFLNSQRMVCSLAAYLRLRISEFPMGGPLNIATLRGVRLRNAAFEYPQIVPYRLLPSEQGLTPGELLVKAITTVIPCATTLTPQQWELTKQAARWNGDYLYNWGLWNVLLSTNRAAPGNPPVLSSEAYALLYEGGGYESLVDNWNCAEAFEYLLVDFPKSAQYLRLANGFQALPETLKREFEDAKGVVKMQHQLLGFEPIRAKDGTWQVELDVLDTGDPNNSRERRYRAKALVLAMPQRSLQLLGDRTPTLKNDRVQSLLGSVMPMPAFKAIVAYGSPWWQKLGIAAGRSTTDLPIRQVYYMDSADPPNTNSLMLATYADGRTDSFWTPLWKSAKAATKYPPKPSALGPTANVVPVKAYEELAPKDFVDTLQVLTAQMHQLAPDEIPEPYFAKVKDWTDDPFGAGWHFWRPGIKVWEALPRLRQPIDGIPVYICGETYTNQQGWVEGALVSAEHVARKHFAVPPPPWLHPSDYYMGP
jgi:monoamine oxidase